MFKLTLDTEIQKLSACLQFLENNYRILASLKANVTLNINKSIRITVIMLHQSHHFYSCSEFLTFTLQAAVNYCINSVRKWQNMEPCKFQKYKICKQNDSSLLHGYF